MFVERGIRFRSRTNPLTVGWCHSFFKTGCQFWFLADFACTRVDSFLTMFITPFGCYCFHRLPFGITSAPEYFQHLLAQILKDLDGVVCLMDDVLMYGKTQEEHDHHLLNVLQTM